MRSILKTAAFLVAAAVLMLGGGLMTADREAVQALISQSTAAQQFAGK